MRKDDNLKAPEKIENNFVDANGKIENDFAFLLTEKTSPVKILGLSSVNGRPDFKAGAKVQLRNVSEKQIISVSLRIIPPVQCVNSMPSAEAIFDSENDKEKSSPISASEDFSLNIPPLVSSSILSPKTFKTCPPDDKKPNIYVWKVNFADGARWEGSIRKIKRTDDSGI
jgi:hypothetical protein